MKALSSLLNLGPICGYCSGPTRPSYGPYAELLTIMNTSIQKSILPVLASLVLALGFAPVRSADAAQAGELTPLAHVEKRGTGEINVILIPALGCDWTVWESFMERNRNRYTSYAVTLPGMAGTDSPPMPADLKGTPWFDNAMAAIDKLIEDEGIVNPVIMGHSLGGQLAVRYAVTRPEKVRAAATLDGMLALPLRNTNTPRVEFIESDYQPMTRQLTQELWVESTERMVRGWLPAGARRDAIAEMISKTVGTVAGQYLAEFYKSDLTSAVLDFPKPLLAVAAINQSYTTSGTDAQKLRDLWAEQFARAPDESVVLFEDTRHFLLYEVPERLDTTVWLFLNEDPRIPGRGD